MAAACVVLVVEDEPLIRLQLADMLEDQGCTTFTASNASEAIATLEENSSITVVFTDIQMPGTMDGTFPHVSHSVCSKWILGHGGRW